MALMNKERDYIGNKYKEKLGILRDRRKEKSRENKGGHLYL